MNLQKVTIGALPQVQTLTVLPLDPDVDFSTLDSVTCAPFGLTIQNGGVEDTIPVSLSTNITGEDIKQALNGTDSMEVFYRSESNYLEFDFVFSASFGAPPSHVPTLALDSHHVIISCVEGPDNGQLLFDVSLRTTQRLGFPNGFNLGFDWLRYTPMLPLNVSNITLQEALEELLTWQCAHQPLRIGTVLLHNSFEEDGSGVRDNAGDIPRAYCGHYSRQSPGSMWMNEEMFEHHPYVSYSCILLIWGAHIGEGAGGKGELPP